MKSIKLSKLSKNQIKDHIFEKDLTYAQDQEVFLLQNDLEKARISPILQFEISFQKCKKLGVLK